MSDSFIKTCKKGSCYGLMSVKKILTLNYQDLTTNQLYKLLTRYR